MRRRTLGTLSTALLILASCGGSDTSSGAGSETAAPVATAPGESTGAPTATAETTGSTDSSSTGTSSPTGTSTGTSSSTEACSTDGSATPLDPLDGDVPDVAIEPAFADSPLPSVALRRINCGPDFVNLKNEAPAALPVLYWFWAPF